MPQFPVLGAGHLSVPTQLGSDCLSPRGLGDWKLGGFAQASQRDWSLTSDQPGPSPSFQLGTVTAQDGAWTQGCCEGRGTRGTRWGHFCSEHFCHLLPAASVAQITDREPSSPFKHMVNQWGQTRVPFPVPMNTVRRRQVVPRASFTAQPSPEPPASFFSSHRCVSHPVLVTQH